MPAGYSYQQGGTGRGFWEGLGGLVGSLGGAAASYLNANAARKEAERSRREAELQREKDFSREIERLRLSGTLTNTNVKYLAFGMLGLGAVMMVFKMVK